MNGHAFFLKLKSIFSRVLLWQISDVFPSNNFLWVIVILSPWYLSIRSFCHVLSIPIIYSKIVFLSFIVLFGLFSCILNLLELSFVISEWSGFYLFCFCFCFVLCFYDMTLSRYFLRFPSFADIFCIFFYLRCILRLVCFFVLVFSSEKIPVYFPFLCTFACCHSFFNCLQAYFPCWLCIAVRVPKGGTDFIRLISCVCLVYW